MTTIKNPAVLTGNQFERIQELEATIAKLNARNAEIEVRNSNLETENAKLCRENRILYVSYNALLTVVIDELHQMSPVWSKWVMENVYRHQLSAAIYEDIENHFNVRRHAA